jgi:hypothetical protein
MLTGDEIVEKEGGARLFVLSFPFLLPLFSSLLLDIFFLFFTHLLPAGIMHVEEI